MAKRNRAPRRLGIGMLWLATSLALTAAAAAEGEQAWVKGEVKLNLRTGPGVEFRSIDTVKTGDPVEILERAEDWTKVRIRGSDEGWIPSGFLQSEPPAPVALARREEEAANLQRRVESLSQELAALREESETHGARAASQQSEVEQLTKENARLRTGARWPEWIAGAALLSAGMLVGAVLHRTTTRRPAPRIRL